MVFTYEARDTLFLPQHAVQELLDVTFVRDSEGNIEEDESVITKDNVQPLEEQKVNISWSDSTNDNTTATHNSSKFMTPIQT